MAENSQLTKSLSNRQEDKKKAAFFKTVLFLLFFPFVLAGCATGPPPLPAPTAQTLRFQVSLNPSGTVSPQFTVNGNTYYGVYRIVINTLDTARIGNQTAVTTNPDTWTDYFELDNMGWNRNDRIALPSSQQPQQWTGLQPVTPGNISGSTFTLALTLPDSYLGNASQFNVSVITYIVNSSLYSCLNPQAPCVPPTIDALGPPVSSGSPISYMNFNKTVTNPNTLSDALGDFVTDPVDFPDLQTSNYINFDIASLTVSVK